MLTPAKQSVATGTLGKTPVKAGWAKLFAAVDGTPTDSGTHAKGTNVALPFAAVASKVAATADNSVAAVNQPDQTILGRTDIVLGVATELIPPIVNLTPAITAPGRPHVKGPATIAQPSAGPIPLASLFGQVAGPQTATAATNNTPAAQAVATVIAQPPASPIPFASPVGQVAGPQTATPATNNTPSQAVATVSVQPIAAAVVAQSVAIDAPEQAAAAAAIAAAVIPPASTAKTAPAVAVAAPQADPGQVAVPEGMTPVQAQPTAEIPAMIAGLQQVAAVSPQSAVPQNTPAVRSAATQAPRPAEKGNPVPQVATAQVSTLRVEPGTGGYEVTPAQRAQVNLNLAAGQTAAAGKLAGETPASTNMNQALQQAISNLTQTHSVAQADAAVPAQKASASAIGDQLVQGFTTLAADGTGHMVVRLDPPDLGSVRLTFESQGNQVRATVQADNPRTLSDMRSEAPALIQRLADNGIQVQSMDMVLTQQGGSHSQNQSQGQNPWQQQGWDQGQSQSHDSWRSHSDFGYTDARGMEPQGELVGASTVSDNAINVWI